LLLVLLGLPQGPLESLRELPLLLRLPSQHAKLL
jgi:hypothetical protein